MKQTHHTILNILTDKAIILKASNHEQIFGKKVLVINQKQNTSI